MPESLSAATADSESTLNNDALSDVIDAYRLLQQLPAQLNVDADLDMPLPPGMADILVNHLHAPGIQVSGGTVLIVGRSGRSEIHLRAPLGDS